MSPKDLERIAHELIATKLAANQVIEMSWAVKELITEQGTIEGDGVEFYDLCAREYVYRIIKRVVDKYDDQEPEEQFILNGFEKLQVAYTVERKGIRQLVPIEQVTDDELLERAKEFDRQIIGLTVHAREIREYVAERQSKIA